MSKSNAVSNIKSDEMLVFFRTCGCLDESSQTWSLPIHGWIYEPENSRFRKGLISEILERKYGLTTNSETKDTFSRIVNLMIADNERGKRIIIRIGENDFPLPKSKPNGHFEATVHLPAADVEAIAKGNVISFEAITEKSESRVFNGEIQLVNPIGTSIISDIDDTIKLSHVTDKKRLIEHTFFKPFETIPGMAAFYHRLCAENIPLHFVSSSPWQLYRPLREMIAADHFPPSTLSLKSVRFKDETLLNLFKKGIETKPAQIEPIIKSYPKRRFILIGDSGEHDPEVYADFMRQYPEQILKVYIRNITDESLENKRFMGILKGLDKNSWYLFNEPPSVLA